VSPRVALHRDQPEQLVDKDNHAWDSLKYFLQRFPPKAMPRTPDQKPNSFQWWRMVAEKAKKGEAIPSYQRQT
ncbi:hypothetical protein LCGC14_2299290, partial [marine sediment metagenome]